LILFGQYNAKFKHVFDTEFYLLLFVILINLI